MFKSQTPTKTQLFLINLLEVAVNSQNHQLSLKFLFIYLSFYNTSDNINYKLYMSLSLALP